MTPPRAVIVTGGGTGIGGLRANVVAAVVTWLLSDAASYVNGAVIPVDGAGTAVDIGTVPFDPRISVRPL